MRKAAGERDYRDFHKSGETRANSQTLPGGTDRRWWDLNGAKCAESVESVINLLQKSQAPRLRQASISMRLYGNFAIFGATGAAYSRLQATQTAGSRDRLTYNAIQSIIDTVNAKVGEIKPRPYYLTSGGNYKQQRKAKKLNQFTDGVFYETKTYTKGVQCFRDAAIWGDGFMFVFARGGKIRHERVLCSEIWVDEEEAQYGFPRNMHRVKVVDRDELAGYFPEHTEAIMRASTSPSERRSVGDSISSMVTVAESWHLGAMDENGELKGGFHSICLPSEGVMLVEPEEWPYDFFPFAKIPWCERPTGYWSQGLAEQLQSDQIELNKELWLIQRSMHMAGTVKVALKNGSKIVKESINNEIGTLITYAGDTPPVFFCPEPIHPVYFENSQRLIARMYDRAGVSELSSAGRKPAGLDSGRALREQQDIESDRFRTIQRQNEDFYLAVASLDLAIAREMKSVDPVRVPGKSSFQTINIKKEIGSLKDSEFVLQCFPVSRLPKDPAGRLQTITEYIQAGFITQRQGRRLLDFPDLDSVEALANAQEDLVTSVLDQIVDDGEYAPPEPTDDLKLNKEMVIEYIQRYRLLELEPEKMSLLRKWNTQVDALIKRTLPPPMPMGPPGAGPQAVPGAPPVSDLLPPIPQAAA